MSAIVTSRARPRAARTLLTLVLAAGPACSDVPADVTDDAGAGDDPSGTVATALVAPIMNAYDPARRGTFQTFRDGICWGWTPLEDQWQVWTGLVTAGNAACDASNLASGCAYPPGGVTQTGPYQNAPRYSREDFSWSHDGRDLNFAFLPTDWTRTAINTNVSLPDQSVVLDVEVEAQYFWPTVNWWDNRYDGVVFREGVTPGNLSYREPWNLPTPQPGDQIVWNGLHVRDDCHSEPAEIHPPQAAAWLRKVGSHDYDLTFNAASHSFRPFRGDRANLPGAWYWFRLEDPAFAAQITYAGDNWLVDPARSYTAFSGYQSIRTCNDGSAGATPDASYAGGDPCRAQLDSHRRVDEYFSLATTSGLAGEARYVGVYLASRPGMENAAGLSVLASGTYRVCQPHPSNGYCAPRLPTFKQVSQGAPKKLRVSLKNHGSGLWGDFEWNDDVIGRRFQQYGFTGGNNQTFNLEHVGTDATGAIFKLQNYHGRFFDACCGGGNGQPVVQEQRYDDGWQQWRLVPTRAADGTGGYLIKNVQSGRCLAIGGGSTAAGADAILWDCLGQADTIWHLSERE
jgi:hypothetical protein